MKWRSLPPLFLVASSPSTRREWIEMAAVKVSYPGGCQSPSTRREWIEIGRFRLSDATYDGSPSTRREWIEMSSPSVSAHLLICLPPHGGSGLKWGDRWIELSITESPSTRREWIEIRLQFDFIMEYASPSTRREWIEMTLFLGCRF